jgi:S-adenosylmethionine synthetase
MPLPIMLAHKLVKRLAECRKTKIIPCLRPDCKSQVTVEYENGKPKSVKAVVIAAQNNGILDDSLLKKEIIEKASHRVTQREHGETQRKSLRGTPSFLCVTLCN